MTQNDELILEAFEARARRRDERRAFFRTAGTATAAVAGASMLTACFGDDDNNTPTPTPTPSATPTPTPTPTATATTANLDVDILNFALQLEYLEAQFYSFAVLGTGLPANMVSGTGVAGGVAGGRQVQFTDPVVRQYALEIASDEIAHVRFLRAALGASAVAQPAIDIGVTPTSAFSNAARASGLIGAGQAFDVYANDENFLLGAFIFEDVGVSAYKGAAPLLTSKTFLDASAGILAAEAYHAGLIRTVLYRKGLTVPSLRSATEAISNARDSLDGPGNQDQGISPVGGASNIVPTDANGLAISRSAAQVLNIVFLTNTATAVGGGFFPSGVNGGLRTSGAN